MTTPAARPDSPGANDGVGGALYQELRRLALAQMAREPQGHTLQATALVHEAWLRLGQAHADEHDSFVQLAATTMRHVLVDHARKNRSMKRGAAFERVPMEMVEGLQAEVQPDLLLLDAALEELRRLDPRAFRIVELRFFGGLEVAQVAKLLEIGERTVKREWATARLWLLDWIRREERLDG